MVNVFEILSIACLVIGVIFLSLGMIGLLRLPDVYNRLHATTKIGTLGAFGVLLSIMIQEIGNSGLLPPSPMGIKALTVGLFILLTSPISGHMIARAAYKMGVDLCEDSILDEYKGERKD
ncbi:MAG: monovalent cation/H(+) antiporter subunit G [Methanosarcinaceae archaeon]|nr:monovalent cation/H(+) antiporter subunit G [Methanosarcinaceae archaeon]MDD4498113.1 monovalent cation/H(+) antiporter subunit G [Methanosarcinaceae archaeon]